MSGSAPFLPYGRQTIEQDDKDAVAAVLDQDYLTTGPHIQEFEKTLCDITTAKEAIVVGNGTHALHLACLAAGLGEGDAAIVPTVTFLATANAVRYCGADVIFSDVNPETGLMEPQHLEQAINDNKDKNIKAVLPVHLSGQTVDLPALEKITRQHDLKMIADSCHALGGLCGNKPVGSCQYEDMSTFSFHPVKAIAMGEGGAITTNNPQTAELLRTYRNHGMQPKPAEGPWYYEMEELGYNYRVTDMQCALGVSQLKKLDRFIEKRRALVALYDELLAPLAPKVLPPKRVANCEPGWHLYAPRFDFDKIGMSRGDFMNALKEKGIGSQVHYIPVHTQPYYTKLYGEKNLPGAQKYYEGTLSIPLFPLMNEDDVRRVVAAIEDLAG
jgi:UDP-4-amino-4,6-dideoxy-N-acetyl-beta-L-altrosamine transaminase